MRRGEEGEEGVITSLSSTHQTVVSQRFIQFRSVKVRGLKPADTTLLPVSCLQTRSTDLVSITAVRKPC